MICLKDYIGKAVINKSNDKGTLVEVQDDFIVVEYKTKKATYDKSAFDEGFLFFENDEDRSKYLIEKLRKEGEAKEKELEKCLLELNSLVGLEEIKDQVNDLICELRIYKYRTAFNLKVPDITRHMIFAGNPGTGKTTVARIVARIYKTLGLLNNGQLIETDRGGLIAGYQGQTALKTKAIIKKALGGVLFIDEAYALILSKDDTYGYEALDTLTKSIEDHRDDLVVILAGYKKEMEDFVSANPGLSSRFKKVIQFSDYNGEELFTIFKGMFTDNDYKLSKEAERYAVEHFNSIKSVSGNGRAMRNIFEETIKHQSRRISSLSTITKSNLMMIELEDLERTLIKE